MRPPARLLLTVSEDVLSRFCLLAGGGFAISAQTGCSVRDLLCGELGVSPEYVDERIQTMELMHNFLSVYIIILIPAVVGISVLSGDIIAVILGQEYQSSRIILPWIAAAVFLFGLSGYYVKSFELYEKTSRLPFIYAGPAILNLVFNFVLIPAIGMQGAAIATFLSACS